MFLMHLCMVALEAQTTLQCVNPPHVLEWALQIFMSQSSQCCGYLFLCITTCLFHWTTTNVVFFWATVMSAAFPMIVSPTEPDQIRMRPLEVLRNLGKWFQFISILIRVWQSEFPILNFFTISNFLRQWNVYIGYIIYKPWWSKFKERNILMIFLSIKIHLDFHCTQKLFSLDIFGNPEQIYNNVISL